MMQVAVAKNSEQEEVWKTSLRYKLEILGYRLFHFFPLLEQVPLRELEICSSTSLEAKFGTICNL